MLVFFFFNFDWHGSTYTSIFVTMAVEYQM